MVAGVAYDVLDVDPRNGGIESFNKMTRELGDDGPETYLQVRTPSGGQHLYIQPLRMGTLHGFLPGLDLQGGKPDGTSRGFVFIPPTERPSKWGNNRGFRPYTSVRDLRAANGSGNVTPIKKLIGKYLELKDADGGTVTRREGNSSDELKLKVQAAGAGDQRMALLRYVHELERRGLKPDEIVTLCMALHIQNYDIRRPWREKDFLGLLHREGKVVADATPEEMAAIQDGIVPLRTGLVRSMVNIEREVLSWVWEQYLARGEFTMADGEKGQGKTFTFDDVAARLSRGDPMPGATEALLPPCNTIIFTYEGVKAVKPRLEAAEADMSRVFVPILDRPHKRGERPDAMDDPLALPFGAPMIGRMIQEADATLAIFDPIADFLSAEIQTHNDASVRLALRPLGSILEKTGCAGLGIRHMNKQKDAGARFRGTGSSAFQNRARVHLIVGELPDQTEEGERQFAIGMADANDTKRVGGALAYKIVDSDIQLDDQGRKVGRVEWLGYVDVDVNTLSRGPSLDGELGIRGPIPVAQEHVCEVLEELFGESQGYAIEAQEVINALRAAGASTSPSVLAKARKRLGIKTVRTREEGGMTKGWTWVMQ
jgi:hypothetical protein